MTTTVAPTETSNKTKVGFRYLGTFAAGSLTLFVALGTITPENQAEILKSARVVYDSTYNIIGAVANIWYLVFPAIAAMLGKFGVDASGWGTMIDKVFAAAKAGDKGAAVAIVNAAASPEIGTKAIINPELARDPATPPTVAVSVAALPVTVKEEVK